jgi:hypothetical protein
MRGQARNIDMTGLSPADAGDIPSAATDGDNKPNMLRAGSAVLHGWRSPAAFQTGAPELDDLRATLTGRPTSCARASMPYGPS